MIGHGRRAAHVGLRAVAVLWALVSLWLALQGFTDLWMVGFPDGYITPYAMATKLPLEILTWLLLAQGLYFLVRALAGRPPGVPGLALQIVAAVVLIVLPIRLLQTCPRWDACSGAYQILTGDMLDDGAGG